MKKKLALIMAALLCSAAVATTLVGCGNEETTTSTAASEAASTADASQAEVPTSVTLAEVRENCDVPALLERHDSITAVQTNKDEKGEVTAETTIQITKDASGKLSYQAISKDSKGEVVYETDGTAEPDQARAVYSITHEVGDQKLGKYLTIVQESSADDALLSTFPTFNQNNSAADTEKEVECVTQDGDLILSTTATPTDDTILDNYYYVNPSNMDLDAWNLDVKDKDGNVTISTEISFTYDNPVTLETSARKTITEDKDATKLTVNLIDSANGETTPEVQEFTVAKDTEVIFYAGEDKKVTIYTDEKQTKAVDTVDLSDDAVTVYVVYENA